MRRIAFGFVMLAALVAMYWVNPDVAWIALFSTATIAAARHIRR